MIFPFQRGEPVAGRPGVAGGGSQQSPGGGLRPQTLSREPGWGAEPGRRPSCLQSPGQSGCLCQCTFAQTKSPAGLTDPGTWTAWTALTCCFLKRRPRSAAFAKALGLPATTLGSLRSTEPGLSSRISVRRQRLPPTPRAPSRSCQLLRTRRKPGAGEACASREAAAETAPPAPRPPRALTSTWSAGSGTRF